MNILAKLFPSRRRAKAAAPTVPARPASPPAPPAPSAPAREYVAQTAARFGWGRLGGGLYGGTDATGETWEMRRDYHEMQADDAVSAATDQLIGDIGSQTIQVIPDDPADRGQQAVADFVRRATEKLGAGDLSSVQAGGVFGLVDAVARPAFVSKASLSQIVRNGHAETQGRWAGKEFFRCVKAKWPATWDLDVDEFLNVRGIINRGHDQRDAPPKLPLDGWILFVNKAMYGQPEGMSLYRAAHRYWVSKHRMRQLWEVFCAKLTGGVLNGSVANAQDAPRFFDILIAAQGAGVIVREPGWELDVINLEQGAGKAIEAYIRYADQAITRAIRGAHLQQLEGQVKDGRGNSQVAAQQSDKITWQHLYRVSETITRYFNTYVVRHNFAAGTPVPTTVLGDLDPAMTLKNLEIADMMRNRLGLPLSRKQLYRMSPFTPPSDDPADVLPPPPVAPAPKPGGRDPALAGLYSEAGRGYPRELDRDIQPPPDGGVDGDGGPPAHLFYDPSQPRVPPGHPAGGQFAGGGGGGGKAKGKGGRKGDRSRRSWRNDYAPHPAGYPTPTRDLPASLTGAAVAAKAAEVPEVADALATLERHFGAAAIQDVTHGLPASAPAAAPRPPARPRHVQLAEREAAARRRLAELEGSHDQEASYDRAQARHELALIDAERRGLAPPEFGGHKFAEADAAVEAVAPEPVPAPTPLVPPPQPQPVNVTLTAPDPELPGVVRELVDALKNPPAPAPAAEFDIVTERQANGSLLSRRVPKGSV